jgi:raffinose/stachyose/melibiose transport system permease protein
VNAGTTGNRRPGNNSKPSLWLLAPALVLFGILGVLPLFGAVLLSFTNWDGMRSPAWDGFDSWTAVLRDPITWLTLRNTIQVVVGSVIVQAPISLLIGVYTAREGRFRVTLAALFFLPLVLSSAAVAIMFKNLLDPNFGLTSAQGIAFLARNWLGNPNTVLWTVILIIAWHFIPLHALLYQAGTRQIPKSLYDAAVMDGAGTVRQFFSITLPQLRHTIVTSTTLMVVGSLNFFDLIFVLTGGGPGYASRVLPLHMYLTGFQGTEMGKASVIATFLAVLGLTLSVLVTQLSGFSKMRSEQEGI